jgi:hypothetical protein
MTLKYAFQVANLDSDIMMMLVSVKLAKMENIAMVG